MTALLVVAAAAILLLIGFAVGYTVAYFVLGDR